MVPRCIEYLPEYRGVTGTPRGGQWAFMGLSGREEEEAKWRARAPQAQFELGRGRHPFSFSPSSPSFPLLVGLGKGGNLLLVGVGIPPWGAP